MAAAAAAVATGCEGSAAERGRVVRREEASSYIKHGAWHSVGTIRRRVARRRPVLPPPARFAVLGIEPSHGVVW